jgi:dihydroflavonol-4-reductase
MPLPDPILVTGATGFFGGNLARRLVERGERVRVTVRHGRRPVALAGLTYESVEADLRDDQALARAARGCRQVYHAAASITFWYRNQARFDEVRDVNVGGTRRLLRAAADAGVERVVHVSTVDAIGLPPPGEIADESTDWPPGRIVTPYAITKREAEALALSADVETVVVNPCFMIGPLDPRPSSGRLLLPLTTGPVVFAPRGGGNNFVDVRDVVAGTIAAMARGRPGERYILGHVNLTYRELFTRALAVLGRRPVLLSAPSACVLAAGYAMEKVARLTGREPLLPLSLARVACAGHYYDPSKAVRELGLPQTPIDIALRDAFAWYRKSGEPKAGELDSPLRRH